MDRVKSAEHVLYAPMTWMATGLRRFIFLRFFPSCSVLLRFDQRILTLQRGGFLVVWLRGGGGVAAVDAAVALGPGPVRGS